MNFEIKSREITEENIHIVTVEIEPKDQIIFCYVLESWEGVFNYTTIDKKRNLLSIKIAGDFSEEAEEVLNFLKRY